MNQLQSGIADQGYELMHGVYSSEECLQMLSELNRLFQQEEMVSIRSSRGTVFAARNVIKIVPEVHAWWQKPRLVERLTYVLGEHFGLVRGLYFDKPSHRSWSLPFHKDMTIAVKDNRLKSDEFSKPTTKAGVPHVEGSESVLANMLTLRIHLDAVTDFNGPLQVIPGSHLSGKSTAGYSGQPDVITCEAGDVLAMRPLVSHASGHSDPAREMHRRILHLEFAAEEQLADGFQWQDFIRPEIHQR